VPATGIRLSSAFGQSARFVTLTPNVAESYVMAEYCGVLSLDTVFDAAMAEAPGRAALHSASMRNDVASARLFMRNMNALLNTCWVLRPSA
jgi:hypothetical protein